LIVIPVLSGGREKGPSFPTLFAIFDRLMKLHDTPSPW
jgi:hypothetical protein